MIRIPIELQDELLTAVYIILGLIIFLRGKAVGTNETTEQYKISEKNSELLTLRREVKLLLFKVKTLTEDNKLYLNTLSGLRHLLRKGEK